MGFSNESVSTYIDSIDLIGFTDIVDDHIVFSKERGIYESILIFSDYRGSSQDTRLVLVRLFISDWAKVFSVKSNVIPIQAYYQTATKMMMLGYENSSPGKTVVLRVSIQNIFPNRMLV